MSKKKKRNPIEEIKIYFSNSNCTIPVVEMKNKEVIRTTPVPNIEEYLGKLIELYEAYYILRPTKRSRNCLDLLEEALNAHKQHLYHDYIFFDDL